MSVYVSHVRCCGCAIHILNGETDNFFFEHDSSGGLQTLLLNWRSWPVVAGTRQVATIVIENETVSCPFLLFQCVGGSFLCTSGRNSELELCSNMAARGGSKIRALCSCSLHCEHSKFFLKLSLLNKWVRGVFLIRLVRRIWFRSSYLHILPPWMHNPDHSVEPEFGRMSERKRF